MNTIIEYIINFIEKLNKKIWFNNGNDRHDIIKITSNMTEYVKFIKNSLYKEMFLLLITTGVSYVFICSIFAPLPVVIIVITAIEKPNNTPITFIAESLKEINTLKSRMQPM